jgi:hypothetical protein
VPNSPLKNDIVVPRTYLTHRILNTEKERRGIRRGIGGGERTPRLRGEVRAHKRKKEGTHTGDRRGAGDRKNAKKTGESERGPKEKGCTREKEKIPTRA